MVKRISVYLTSLLCFVLSVILFFYQPLNSYFNNKYRRLGIVYTAEQSNKEFLIDAFGDFAINAAFVFAVAVFIFLAYQALSDCDSDIIKKCCTVSTIIAFAFCLLVLFSVDLIGEGWQGFEAIIAVFSVVIVAVSGIVMLFIRLIGKEKTEYITFVIFNIICVLFNGVISIITEKVSVSVLSVVFIINVIISTINKYVKEDKRALNLKQRLIAAAAYLLITSCILSFSFYVIQSERKSYNDREYYSISQFHNSDDNENSINS